MKIWMNGALVERENARVSVLDHGLLYGDGLFEGIRLYAG
ncbi:MAG: branched-chain amino acid aminotransferase, partial [Polyangiaceae bacterium]|nr:branched-chain amino acid aminotransferase [Polyangiaceae bacterium]